jgi:transcriptional regulator with XRE-family HTH domain
MSITVLEVERRRRGLSRRQFAELIGRSVGRVATLEQGKGHLNGTGKRQLERLFGRPWAELAAPVPPPSEEESGDSRTR